MWSKVSSGPSPEKDSDRMNQVGNKKKKKKNRVMCPKLMLFPKIDFCLPVFPKFVAIAKLEKTYSKNVFDRFRKIVSVDV